MQTFLPYPNYSDSARCLDQRRLGKQRVEVLQILNTLTDPAKKGWKNHPCTKMWRGFELELVRYGLAVCEEWRARGFRDTVLDQLQARTPSLAPCTPPPWLGDPRLHNSHRAALLRKDADFYRQFGWNVELETEPFWPVA